MSKLLKTEIYEGCRAETIGDLFLNEVTGTNPDFRKEALSAIKQTTRAGEDGTGCDLPQFFLNVMAYEFAQTTAPVVQKEFDLIRI